MKKRSGQAATEYAMIVGFAMLVILPATYFFYVYSSSSEKRIEEAQINKVARDITVFSEKVYYMGGYPSQTVLDEQFPDNIRFIWVTRNWSINQNLLSFWIETGDGIYERSYPVDVNIMGLFTERDYNPGNRKLRIAASHNRTGAPFVLITLDSNCYISTDYDINNDGGYDANDLAVCTSVPCGSGTPATGVCEPCDYNGNCIVDNNDLVMWNMLSNGNSPPTASIYAPKKATVGIPVQISATSVDVDNNLNIHSIFYTPTSTNASVHIITCGAAMNPCETAWTPPAQGEYYIYLQSTDTEQIKCSGNPFGYMDGTADCGFSDYVTVTVT
ncbi:hypothetical protein HYU11_03475 [Candidatus Woesearchaeota archaeon]|nr:hypothetical protein [Candidatus Woesearchaeota archaeon]